MIAAPYYKLEDKSWWAKKCGVGDVNGERLEDSLRRNYEVRVEDQLLLSIIIMYVREARTFQNVQKLRALVSEFLLQFSPEILDQNFA